MNASEYLSTVEAIHGEARRRGVFFQMAENEELRGRTVELDGRSLTSFASCSYLGLEFHPALVEGVVEAVRRYGTQFSSSRGYLSAPQYRELEAKLGTLFGGYPLVTGSTSLGHQIVLPVLATEKDAIVMDNQAHHSMHAAATLAQARGATVETVRHFELDTRALETVERLARRHRTVYFLCDGVYSMYGDFAPFGLLQQILDVAPNVRLYVDDAHGMSWAGEHGRGFFLSRMAMSDRIVLGTSLNKAFSAAGGCFVFSTEEERERVRICGGPYVFSGPVQPPMLGAALASAELHMSGEIAGLQATYRERADICNVLLSEYGLPLLARNEGPIFFLKMGRVEAAIQVIERLKEEGYFLSLSAYPSVPQRRAGIRLTLTALHTPAEIHGVVEALAHHVSEAMEEHGITAEELDTLYRNSVPRESLGGSSGASPVPAAPAVPGAHVAAAGRGGAARRLPAGWSVETHESILAVGREEWDRHMGGRGASSWDALRMAEALFRAPARPEHDWEYRYLVVRGPDGAPAAMTYYTRCLVKDDMFMQAEVSEEIERLRRDDPYFLTSRVVMMGSPFSEGHHLYLDRSGAWQEALGVVVDELQRAAAAWDVSAVVLRDFPGDDAELDGWMWGKDYIKVPILNSHRLSLAGTTEEGMVAEASWRTRRFLKGLIAESAGWRMRILGVHGERPADPELAAHLHRLYVTTASRRLRINDFRMPEGIVEAMLASPAWEILALTLDPAAGGPADGRPVAWGAAHRGGGDYAGFMCGVDPAYAQGREFGAYRQLLLHTVRRARDVGAATLHLGMDADVEKGRFGSTPHPTCMYVLSRDHDSGDRMNEIVTAVGLRSTVERAAARPEPDGAAVLA